MDSLLKFMELGKIEEYNVKLYKEQIRSLWSETKKAFKQVLDLKTAYSLEEGEKFYQQTVAWDNLFKSIQETYQQDNDCFTVQLGEEPAGEVAAAIVDFRYKYGYYLHLPFIEENESRLKRELDSLKNNLTEMEYILEKHLPGVTKENFIPSEMPPSKTYQELIRELKIAYLDPKTRGYPLLITWSGGKDSTLLCKAIFEVLMALPEHRRIRDIHIVYVDTKMEVPLIMDHVSDTLQKMQNFAEKNNLPVTVHRAEPEVSQRFLPLVIGLGYPPPQNSKFRFCTERLKLRPINNKIAELLNRYEGVINVTGTRESESATRKQSIQKNSSEMRYDAKSGGKDASYMLYQPIRYFDKDTVWASLKEGGFPWGDGYERLERLYRESGNGRHGCYFCCYIVDDWSMKAFIENGHTWLKPLYDYRDFLLQVANDPDMREDKMINRKSGKIMKQNTKGGLNKKAREILFSELLRVREEVAAQKPEDIDFDVITDEEINQIYAYWEILDGLTCWNPDDAALTLF